MNAMPVCLGMTMNAEEYNCDRADSIFLLVMVLPTLTEKG